MKLLFALIMSVSLAFVGCNESGLQSANTPKVKNDKTTDDDSDEVSEPVMVAGAYLVCWPHTTPTNSDGSENVGCRLEDEVTGNKKAGKPENLTWSVEKTRLKLLDNDLRFCSENDDCHVIISNIFSRTSKTLMVTETKSGKDYNAQANLGELSSPPADRPNLRFVDAVTDNADAIAQQKKEGSIGGGLQMFFGAMMGDGQTTANGLTNIIVASSLSPTQVEEHCRNTAKLTSATSTIQGSGDTAALAQNGKLCFMKKEMKRNSAGDCYVMDIKYGTKALTGVFKGFDSTGDLHARVQDMYSRHQCK